MSNKFALSPRTIEDFMLFMVEPEKNLSQRARAWKERQLRFAYKALTGEKRGSKSHSRYSAIGDRAGQGDVNALSFLEIVARQLEDRAYNAPSWKAKNPRFFQEDGYGSPLARKIRSQYRAELEKLPALQVDSLWNEILSYAKRGFDYSMQTSAQRLEVAHYPVPQIALPEKLDFLLLPLAAAAIRQPLDLNDYDGQKLERDRRRATREHLGPYSAVGLIESAASVMGQIARIHGIDISGKIAEKNHLVDRLQGIDLIHSFKSGGRNKLYGLAAEGDVSRVFYEIDDVARKAEQYGVHLESLITKHEVDYLKRRAVNHPKTNLRGELLGIAQAVASGETWRKYDLSTKIDFYMPFSDDKALAAAYQRIKSAIFALANAAYGLRPMAVPVPLETSVASAEPVAASAGITIPSMPKLQHEEPYQRISMNEKDAKAILSMLESGDLEGIVNYRFRPALALVKTDSGRGRLSIPAQDYRIDKKFGKHRFSYPPENRREKREMYPLLGFGSAVAAVAIYALFFGNSGQAPGQSAQHGKKIAIDCPDTPTRFPRQEGRLPLGESPYVCKQSEPPVEKYIPEFPKSPLVLRYNVPKYGNLTHAVKRILTIGGGDEHVERAAYLTALELARFNDISNPDLIQPGPLKFPSNLKERYNRHLAK